MTKRERQYHGRHWFWKLFKKLSKGEPVVASKVWWVYDGKTGETYATDKPMDKPVTVTIHRQSLNK